MRSHNCSHHGQVVADEQNRQSRLAFEVRQQADDLFLNGDIERTDGFVANQQSRLQHHGPCDADSLTLAAAELMRIASCQGRLEPDTRQRL